MNFSEQEFSVRLRGATFFSLDLFGVSVMTRSVRCARSLCASSISVRAEFPGNKNAA
jgi:hypothetical protein